MKGMSRTIPAHATLWDELPLHVHADHRLLVLTSHPHYQNPEKFGQLSVSARCIV
jgi:hypothetical protein